MIRQAVQGQRPVDPSVTGAAADSWKDATIVDRHHPEGWVPEQGQIYTVTFDNGATIRYMLHGELMGVEYTHPDGMTHYSDIDAKGNTHSARLPHDLGEYTVLVPEDLEVSRQETSLPDGKTLIDITLKWGNRVQYRLDADRRLDDIRVKGPHVYRNRKKVIEILPPGYLDRKARGEV